MKSEEQRFEDDFEKIISWYRDETRYPLSDSLKGQLDRWKFAREWILLWKPLTDSAVVSVLMQTYPISEPQAWRDVRNTKRFFASMEKTNQEYDRIMLVADIRDLRVKAENAKDYRTVAQCNATLQKMGVGASAEKEESTESKNIELIIGFNPKLLGAKEIPNLLEVATKFIGEEAARRELMIQEENQL